MRPMNWTRILATSAVMTGALAWAGQASAQVIRRPPSTIERDSRQDRAQYSRGYDDGYHRGQVDARKNKSFNPSAGGNRDVDFRQGFDAGYRAGFDQVRRDRGIDRRDDPRDGVVFGRRSGGGYQEPAFARGYSDGYKRGVDDGRDRKRYDPVGEKDYREADQGYYGGYGSKDAYKNNYRTGFRQGYEEGYRDGGNRRY